MSTAKHLLPSNSSLLEKRLADVLKVAVQNELPIKSLINPDTCPAPLLPYLAWTFSVDGWEENWDESKKRNEIKQSFYVHKKKGTVSAVRRIVESMGYDFSIIEWFNDKPPAKPGTFKIEVEIANVGISNKVFEELDRLIEDAKPVSRHLTQLAITSTIKNKANAHIGSFIGEIITVYPKDNA
ncbi:phage tail protein I [Actinobacillus lignieresii]|uniref:Bacteriophage P2-related tail formation protein n=1 Tax=Actinobacillus lignieresii TaxID=720 RepID=A0A380TTJ4_ACTLI|nr:phage tail protein I [Actinobacillus lignieresii]SUT91534.1 Bacteriophage P2-related tail formation protein [Actinobacillus lignieresii]